MVMDSITKKRILLVDSEYDSIQQMLKKHDYNVVASFSTGEELIEKMNGYAPDVLLMGIQLPGKLDGIETVKHIKKSLDAQDRFFAVYDPGLKYRRPVIDLFITVFHLIRHFLFQPFPMKNLKSIIDTSRFFMFHA